MSSCSLPAWASGCAPACRRSCIRLAGRPLLAHVLETARKLAADRICVVYGHGGDAVRSAFPTRPALGAAGSAARNRPRAGAGAAALAADGVTLVLFGADPAGARRNARSGRRHARGGRAVAADDRARRSHRLRPHRARRRTARCRRSSSTRTRRRAARDPRDQHRRDGGADRALARWLKAVDNRQRERRVLPHRRHRAGAAEKASPIETSRAGDASRRSASTRCASSPTLERLYQRAQADALLDARRDARRSRPHRRPRHARLRRRRDDRRRLRVRGRRCAWATAWPSARTAC